MVFKLAQLFFITACLAFSVSAGDPDPLRTPPVQDVPEHEVTIEDVKKLLLRQQLRCQPGTLGRVSLLAFDEVRQSIGVDKQTYESLAEQVKTLKEKSHRELAKLSTVSSGHRRDLTEADVLAVAKLVEGWMEELDAQLESTMKEKSKSDLLSLQFALLGAEVLIDPAFQKEVSCSKKERIDIEDERNRFLNEHFATIDPLSPVPVPEHDAQSAVSLATELTKRLTATCDTETRREIEKLKTRGNELVGLLERLRGSASSPMVIPN